MNDQIHTEWVLFIDEMCPLCHWSLYLVDLRNLKRIGIAPLGGLTALKYLPEELVNSKKTVVLLHMPSGKVYVRSTAIAQLFELSGRETVGRLIKLLRPLCEVLYIIIARLRPRFKNKCPLPPQGITLLP